MKKKKMNGYIFSNWLSVSSKNLNRGFNYGHKSIRGSKTHYWHPLLSNYFLGLRQNVSILNTQQTLKCLLRSFYIIAQILNKKGHILIINTNPEFFRLCSNCTNGTPKKYSPFLEIGKSSFLKNVQMEKNVHQSQYRTPHISYVYYKWIGGTLTNWYQISKSVSTFALFSERCEQFLLKNNIDFPKYNQVRKCFQGLLYKQKDKMVLAFTQKPDLIFIINPNENQGILHEAFKLDIPVIALTEANTNPKQILYPIPVNNYSIQLVYFCLKKIIKMASI